jgi:hypothetical protein
MRAAVRLGALLALGVLGVPLMVLWLVFHPGVDLRW